MASQFDDTDFIDRDFEQSEQTAVVTGEEMSHDSPEITPPVSALPTREELEAKVGDTQVRLAQLKRQQEDLEQRRVALEETRRRRKEFHGGKTEMVQHLTRGIAMLEESELALRRDCNQMNKSLEAFREGLDKINGYNEEDWTAENVEVELTRALTAIDNARMEWNSARLKWSFLDGEGGLPEESSANQASTGWVEQLADLPFKQLCRIGLALTWPLALIGLVLLALRFF